MAVHTKSQHNPRWLHPTVKNHDSPGAAALLSANLAPDQRFLRRLAAPSARTPAPNISADAGSGTELVVPLVV